MQHDLTSSTCLLTKVAADLGTQGLAGGEPSSVILQDQAAFLRNEKLPLLTECKETKPVTLALDISDSTFAL